MRLFPLTYSTLDHVVREGEVLLAGSASLHVTLILDRLNDFSRVDEAFRAVLVQLHVA